MIIRYTPAAREDLAQTKEYIEMVLKNPIAAQNVTNRIIQKCSILKEQPMCGVSLSERTGRDTDLRFLVCENRLAFYRIDGNYISIIRILDGRTNYMKVIFPDK